MRRRLWWHIYILDVRIAEDHGSDPHIMDSVHDTELPLNVGDTDLNPDLSSLPQSQAGKTEMLFSLVRFRYIEQFLTERYNLDKSGGEKPIMNVDDLYRAQYTHWVSDQVTFADERQRIQLALLILIQAYTATRPRVLTYRKPNKIAIEDYHYRWDGKKTMWDMDDDEPAKPEDDKLMKSEDDESGESDSEEHMENEFKTLCYKDIKLYLIKGGDGERDRLVMEVTLRYTKGWDRKPLPKTFTISEVDNLLFDATIPFLALAFLDNAFESGIRSVSDIYLARVRVSRESEDFHWRKDILNTPIFRQPMKQEDGICRTSKTEALYYDTYRRDLRKLGMIAGFRQVLKPYAIRRGGGEAIEKVGTQGQLQQVMSHASDLTYQAYINPRVQVDTVAAFLKRPPNQRLLEMATHMSRDADPSAPTGATPADIETKGVIIALTKNRDSLKKAIRSKYGTIGKAKEVNPELWTQYDTTKRKLINCRKKLLEREVMKQRKAYFKESSTKEINRQLQKKENPAIESGTPSVPPKPSYTLPERKTLAEFICADASNLETQMRLRHRMCTLHAMITLGERKEFRQKKATTPSIKLAMRPKIEEPTECSIQQCFLCFWNEDMSSDGRRIKYSDKYGARRHIEARHFKNLSQRPVACPEPRCEEKVFTYVTIDAFKNHLITVHNYDIFGRYKI
ncbi:C6 transcription factor asaR [Cladobotryum mycophilum]|uniref:C6 transcription factor asaR n=2 Tax=Cladobotryum mycophilum TaxID=491253 RepID=A0ABR0SBN4_9HYPO